jgi:5-dehydro-4-deoxyglucarate dehydratase
MTMTFGDGVLFFPVTPFDEAGRVQETLLVEHVRTGLEHGAGGVFAACGTGEFHALSVEEHRVAVHAAVVAAGGRVPVVAGTGGPLGHALACARGAAEAGADGLLVLPPYLVTGSQDGLVAYVEAIAAASGLPVIAYHRANAALTPAGLRRLLELPALAGVKDGVGDVALMQELVLTAQAAGRHDLEFFNGLLTAEMSQAAYAAIGVPRYSSAVFAMAPEIATAFRAALVSGDDATRTRLLDAFYAPLVRLRDETPGFAVSLIKAGLRLGGVRVGSVRPPLTDPTPEQERRLAALLDTGRALVVELPR